MKKQSMRNNTECTGLRAVITSMAEATASITKYPFGQATDFTGRRRPFVLGGIAFDHDRGPVAHSDGDVLMHAVTDAILGALGEPDIGQLFPDNAPENDGRDSRVDLPRRPAAVLGQ